jgi:hypothetical protein
MVSQSNLRRRLVVVGISVVPVIFVLGAALRPAEPVSANIAGCPMFPSDNVWNTRADTLPVHTQSNAYVTSISANKQLHPDFGSGQWQGLDIGTAYAAVPGSQPKITMSFGYASQSDPGPYPIPANPPIEGGDFITNAGDRHMLIVDTTNCKLYETWDSHVQSDGSWYAGSGAIFTLTSNMLRPDTWTSADAAGLPILPGLARYDEATSGVITHALRFTVHCSLGYIWPARHQANYQSNLCATPPPMGLRFRLKASYPITPTLDPQVKVILTALKQYGMFVADNSSSGDWYVSGLHDPNWNDDALVSQLKLVKGSDFEAVNESALMVSPDSGQARLLNRTVWLPLLVR